MAADTSTGGTLQFKGYYSGANNMKVVVNPVEEVSAAAGWTFGLFTETGAVVMGYKVGGAGALEPVTAGFTGVTGYANAGSTWKLDGFAQGATVNFMVGAYKGSSYDVAGLWAGKWGTYQATLGGDDLTPPGPAGQLNYAGALTKEIIIPEPSVLALGLLGMGAFLIRPHHDGEERAD